MDMIFVTAITSECGYTDFDFFKFEYMDENSCVARLIMISNDLSDPLDEYRLNLELRISGNLSEDKLKAICNLYKCRSFDRWSIDIY